MMCDEACAAEMKACEGSKDDKEAMMRCMRGELAKDTEGKGKCMMCKKKMDMKDDDDKMMCMKECAVEMKACEGDKDSEEDFKRCMRGQMEKNSEGRCMMCKKKAMEDDKDKMMCTKECAVEMKACEGDKDSEEDFKRCMRGQMEKNSEGRCMMCKKKAMEDD